MQAHHVPGAHGPGDEGVRQPVGAAVHGRVVQRPLTVHHGHRLPTRPRLCLEQRGDPGRRPQRETHGITSAAAHCVSARQRLPTRDCVGVRVGHGTGPRVGHCVGLRVGLRTGLRVGRWVGLRVRRRVGEWVGLRVGFRTGPRCGRCVGLRARRRVGEWVGLRVGDGAGRGPGSRVGHCVGLRVGFRTGLRCGRWVGLRVRRRVGDRVGLRVGHGAGRGTGLRFGRGVGPRGRLCVGDRVGLRVMGRGISLRVGIRTGPRIGHHAGSRGGSRARRRARRRVALSQQLPYLLRGHQFQVADVAVGVVGHVGQQAAQVLRPAPYRGVVEQGGRVVEVAVQAPLGLGHRQGEVELGRGVGDGQRPALDAGQVEQVPAVRDPGQHGLEQRSVRGAARGIDQLDDPLEGQILVGQGLPDHGPGTGERLRGGRRAGQIDAQGKRVDQKADEAGRPGPAPVRHRTADNDVIHPGQAGEQNAPPGQHRHERGGPVPPRQRTQRWNHVRVQRELDPAPLVPLLPGTRPVGRQIQHGRRPRQRPLPVPFLVREGTGQHCLALGLCVVGVLCDERCQRDRLLRQQRRVDHAEFAHHDGHRRAVVHAVMERQQQRVSLGGQREQPAAPEGARLQVELLFRFPPLQGGDCADHGVGVGEAAEVLLGQCEAGAGRVDELPDTPRIGHQPRAQRLVAVAEDVQGPGQRGAVERAGERERHGLVVRGARAG